MDEASLLSARDTAKLFDLTEKQNARVIPVGDVKQRMPMKHDKYFAWLAKRLKPSDLLGPDVLGTAGAAHA